LIETWLSQEERFIVLKETADKQFVNLVNSQKSINKLEEMNKKKLK
jgi:hypothetical protein